jgi:hypothetical protein
MLIAQGAFSHISKFDSSLGTRIHKPVTTEGMELGSSDNFGELLHIYWLDVHNVEALVLYIQIPQINSQVVAANESLPVAVDRDAVDVVCVCVGVCPTGYGGDDGIVMC